MDPQASLLATNSVHKETQIVDNKEVKTSFEAAVPGAQAMSEEAIHEAKSAIEALLFASDQPLNAMQLARILPYEKEQLETWLLEIAKAFEERKGGFKLHQIQGGYKWLTDERLAKYVEQLPGVVQLEKISLAACEVLALLAQKGSLTRAEIEKLRGVDSSGVIQSLIEKELLETSVRSSAPGMPQEFRLTLEFYTRFGINQRRDLHLLFLHRFAEEGREASGPEG